MMLVLMRLVQYLQKSRNHEEFMFETTYNIIDEWEAKGGYYQIFTKASKKNVGYFWFTVADFIQFLELI